MYFSKKKVKSYFNSLCIIKMIYESENITRKKGICYVSIVRAYQK